MKTIQTTTNFAKTSIAICILCFTLIGTTSCSKDKAINPNGSSNIDQNLVGKWEKQDFLGNNVSVTQETFNADGTGLERTFDLNDGSTRITNEKPSSFTWFVKSDGVFHLKNSFNEEFDVNYFVTDNSSEYILKKRLSLFPLLLQ